MDFDTIIKIGWGAVVLLIVIVSRVRAAKAQREGEEQAEFAWEELESELSATSPDEQRAEFKTRVVHPVQRAKVENVVVEEENRESKESKKNDFDLRQAVIMSEILTPKFKDE